MCEERVMKSGATRRGGAAKRAETSARKEMDVREFRAGDDDPSLAAFAERNPGLFLLALDERGLAATALGGWDGRRGWLYHVAVRAADQRRRGLGARLV